MRHTLPAAVILLIGISAVVAVPAGQDGSTEAAKLLAASRTICVILGGPSALGTEISRELRTWGRLREVSRPEDADLLMRVGRQPDAVAYGEFRHDEGGGVAFGAVVTHRESRAKLWSTSKGRNWEGSDGRGSWAGKAIARGFTEYFDKTVSRGTK